MRRVFPTESSLESRPHVVQDDPAPVGSVRHTGITHSTGPQGTRGSKAGNCIWSGEYYGGRKIHRGFLIMTDESGWEKKTDLVR